MSMIQYLTPGPLRRVHKKRQNAAFANVCTTALVSAKQRPGTHIKLIARQCMAYQLCSCSLSELDLRETLSRQKKFYVRPE